MIHKKLKISNNIVSQSSGKEEQLEYIDHDELNKLVFDEDDQWI